MTPVPAPGASVLLAPAFRSILIPLTATVGFPLSVLPRSLRRWRASEVAVVLFRGQHIGTSTPAS